MSPAVHTRARRVAGLAGLLGAAALLVTGKAVTAPSPPKAVVAAPNGLQAPTAGSVGPTQNLAVTPPTQPTQPPSPSQPTSVGPSSTPGSTNRTITGDAEDVSYGTVQVQVTLDNGRIVDVAAVQLPHGGRSSEIAAYAAPRLRAEALTAQSAHIDAVSGASYTSEGYARSLQSALDAAAK